MIKKIGLIFIIIFIGLSIDFAIAGSPNFTCGIVDLEDPPWICNAKFGYWCTLLSPGISSCYVGYAPTEQSSVSSSYCTATNRLGQLIYACESGSCPSFPRNVTCHIKKTCGLFPACGGRDFNGKWDASENKCVECNGRFENKICGDSSGIQLTCAGSCNSGDGQFESACGAASGCDEKSSGNLCGTTTTSCNDYCSGYQLVEYDNDCLVDSTTASCTKVCDSTGDCPGCTPSCPGTTANYCVGQCGVCPLNKTGNLTISSDCAIAGDMWLTNGNLTITGATVTMLSNSSFTFTSGYQISMGSNGYILKSDINTVIQK